MSRMSKKDDLMIKLKDANELECKIIDRLVSRENQVLSKGWIWNNFEMEVDDFGEALLGLGYELHEKIITQKNANGNSPNRNAYYIYSKAKTGNKRKHKETLPCGLTPEQLPICGHIKTCYNAYKCASAKAYQAKYNVNQDEVGHVVRMTASVDIAKTIGI